MSLADLTRSAVLAAIEEYDRLGREDFLRGYGFGPARDYRVMFNGREYDSKAIRHHRLWEQRGFCYLARETS
jgi:hypothetical protein